MQIRAFWLVVLFLTFSSWASAMQSSNLVGTWVGKVQGYGVEMRFVLNADGSAELEGVIGGWRVQGSRLLLTQEGETVAYNFTLRGSTLTLSGGDLMAPMVMTRAAGGEVARTRVPRRPEPDKGYETTIPAGEDTRTVVQPMPPPSRPARSGRGLSEQDVVTLLEGGVPSGRVIELVEERGVAFPVSPASMSRLKEKRSNECADRRTAAGGRPSWCGYG